MEYISPEDMMCEDTLQFPLDLLEHHRQLLISFEFCKTRTTFHQTFLSAKLLPMVHNFNAIHHLTYEYLSNIYRIKTHTNKVSFVFKWQIYLKELPSGLEML